MKAKLTGTVVLEMSLEDATAIKKILGARSVYDLKQAQMTSEEVDKIFSIHTALREALGGERSV